MTGLVKCLSLLTKLFGELIIVVSGSRVSQHFSFHLSIMCISCASKSVKERGCAHGLIDNYHFMLYATCARESSLSTPLQQNLHFLHWTPSQEVKLEGSMAVFSSGSVVFYSSRAGSKENEEEAHRQEEWLKALE